MDACRPCRNGCPQPSDGVACEGTLYQQGHQGEQGAFIQRFSYSIGENGAPIINDAKVSIECEVDGNYELENFDNFICRIQATYADDCVLNADGKIDYHVFKPVLFEFPTYEYFVTGDAVGKCGRMNG